jgi:hypothetical protein
MFYKATLCLSSFRQFLYWHKWNGGGGWSEMSFYKWSVCLLKVFVSSATLQLFGVEGWHSSLLPQRSEESNVLYWVGNTPHKKYDS